MRRNNYYWSKDGLNSGLFLLPPAGCSIITLGFDLTFVLRSSENRKLQEPLILWLGSSAA